MRGACAPSRVCSSDSRSVIAGVALRARRSGRSHNFTVYLVCSYYSDRNPGSVAQNRAGAGQRTSELTVYAAFRPRGCGNRILSNIGSKACRHPRHRGPNIVTSCSRGLYVGSKNTTPFADRGALYFSSCLIATACLYRLSARFNCAPSQVRAHRQLSLRSLSFSPRCFSARRLPGSLLGLRDEMAHC